MPDVFISYKKSDADRVRPLVDNLRAAGLDVWWDGGIQPSTSWRVEIAKQLNAAKCVVAVWTQDSVDPEGGQWVMEEAGHGQARKVLAPVRLDLVNPPLGFGEVQYADLAVWSGGADDPRFQHFLGIVRAIVASEPIPQAPRPTHFEAPGIKLQGVRMENVNIQVGGADGRNSVQIPPGGSLHLGGQDGPGQLRLGGDGDDDSDDQSQQEARVRAPFSPSLFMAQAVGVILPLVAIVIFVFTMGGMACAAGNAPGFFCDALDALR